MSYIGNVKVGSATHLVGSTLYGTCNTAAGTAEKSVTCANFDQLLTGVTIHVKFDNTNTIANPTLNVNNTGAKAIKRYGTTAPSTSVQTSWYAGAVISFTYDGTYWMMDDWTYTADGSDTSQLRAYYSHPTAGGNGIKQYSLFAKMDDGTYSSFTTNSGTGTKTNDTTHYFDINKIYYANRSTDLASGSVMSNDQMAQQVNLVDCRYTFNGITTSSGFTADKPVYLMFSYSTTVVDYVREADVHLNHYKLYIKDGNIWTHEPFVDSSESIIFVLIGYAYDTYRINLLLQNFAFLYNGASLIQFHERVTSGLVSFIDESTEPETIWTLGKCATAEGFMTLPNGDYSHTEGSSTFAIGKCSHAEGNNTSALGDYAHVEGSGANALGMISHAEGYSRATGNYSHAEGSFCQANGDYSHAEGYSNYTNGNYSHAEGHQTKADGVRSHSEGYGTIAKGEAQHAEGKWNVEDTNGTYAHIIGGGTSNSDRKNIFTVSWDGDVTAGRSTGIENSNKLVTGADIYSAGLMLDYSTTEQATGKHWIDGKEIYQLTVDCGYMPAATQNKTVNLTYSDGTYIPIDMVVNYTSMATSIGGDSLDWSFLINNYTGIASQGAMNIYITSRDKGAGEIRSTISIYCNSDRTNYKLYFTLWYTKRQ